MNIEHTRISSNTVCYRFYEEHADDYMGVMTLVERTGYNSIHNLLCPTFYKNMIKVMDYVMNTVASEIFKVEVTEPHSRLLIRIINRHERMTFIKSVHSHEYNRDMVLITFGVKKYAPIAQ